MSKDRRRPPPGCHLLAFLHSVTQAEPGNNNHCSPYSNPAPAQNLLLRSVPDGIPKDQAFPILSAPLPFPLPLLSESSQTLGAQRPSVPQQELRRCLPEHQLEQLSVSRAPCRLHSGRPRYPVQESKL